MTAPDNIMTVKCDLGCELANGWLLRNMYVCACLGKSARGGGLDRSVGMGRYPHALRVA